MNQDAGNPQTRQSTLNLNIGTIRVPGLRICDSFLSRRKAKRHRENPRIEDSYADFDAMGYKARRVRSDYHLSQTAGKGGSKGI